MHVNHDPAAPAGPPITFDDFVAVELTVDFGPGIGTKRSSAQVTEHYRPEDLIGRQVAAVVNLPPRQIGKFRSEVLTLGFADEAGAVVLFRPDSPVPDGSRLF